MNYEQFLQSKRIVDPPSGFNPQSLPSRLFNFQSDIVNWSCRRGRAALFEDCGLGKTAQQLAWANEVVEHTDSNVLILAPLAVADQTVREGQKFGITVNHASDQSTVTNGINVTNYDKLHRFDPAAFNGIVLDESSILKSYSGKVRNQIIGAFCRTPYRLACSATPAPNDYMELGNHAEFLGVMSQSEMLATFFTHDGGDTSKWRLKGHAEADFWKWICSWAVNIRKPSDLGYSDGTFQLPPLNILHHVVESNCQSAGFLFPMPASSLQERRDARKGSLSERVEKSAELANSDRDQWLIWCDLNDESKALAKRIIGAVEITGSDTDEHKTSAMLGFADGSIRTLVTKPSIAGFGMNWQGSHNQIYCGLSDSYERLYQGIRRQWRFGQRNTVNVHVITSNLEGAVVENIKRKEADAQRMATEMVRYMTELSSQQIKGWSRTMETYNPNQELILPNWITSEAA